MAKLLVNKKETDKKNDITIVPVKITTKKEYGKGTGYQYCRDTKDGWRRRPARKPSYGARLQWRGIERKCVNAVIDWADRGDFTTYPYVKLVLPTGWKRPRDFPPLNYIEPHDGYFETVVNAKYALSWLYTEWLTDYYPEQLMNDVMNVFYAHQYHYDEVATFLRKDMGLSSLYTDRLDPFKNNEYNISLSDLGVLDYELKKGLKK